MAAEKITVTDTDGDGALTISDALYCAHEKKYEGGAAAGFAAEPSQYGLSLVKLWGDTSGAFGYYLNNASPLSLLDAVENGDSVTAFIYQDTIGWSDAYSYFDKQTVTVKAGESIALTLSYLSLDPETWATSVKPAEGATVTVNGQDTEFTADANGKVTLDFDKEGTYLVSARSDMNIVSPVCVVTVVAPPAPAEVTVSIINGSPVMAAEKITVTDTDGDGALTISDALYCAHEKKYEGGAAAGFAAEPSQYGLSLVKLWGDTSGAFGYYLNNASPLSLLDAVENGDSVTAFIYQDTIGWSDAYSYFDKQTVTVKAGESIALTLSYLSLDPETWATSVKPAEGATVTVNGQDTEFTADANGKVTLDFDKEGTYLVSARSDMNIVSPVCVVTVVAPPAPAEVTVSIINGSPVMAAEKITVTDTDGDGVLTISDALYCAHEKKYEGGAAAGFAAEPSQYGLSLVKLWGDTSGAFGYYLNNASPLSLLDEVENGDSVTAFIYQDTIGWSDAYSYFDKQTVTVKAGESIALTLSYLSLDPETWATSVKPAEGATVTVNGQDTEFTVNMDGKVTLKLEEEGTYLISAHSDLNIVSPVCVVTVEKEASVITPPVSDPAPEPQSYGWIVAICAAVICVATAVAIAISKKNGKSK